MTLLHKRDYEVAGPTAALHKRDYEVAGPNINYSMYKNSTNNSQTRKGETIEFTTKTISYFYQGKILTYTSGINLSYNKLTGKIPHQIENLIRIHTLNFSYNMV